MQRRDFITSSLAAAGVGALLREAQGQENAPAPAREYYELRVYHLRRGPQTEGFDRFYRDAAIPALNRAGISRVGVFGVAVGPESPSMYVLIPHASMESVATITDKLLADPEYQKAGAEFINAPPASPAYIRIESSLMVAFAGMPRLEVLPRNKARLFELRTYESHSKQANKKKIAMFNESEMAIFHRNRLTPIFFGETLVGSKLPNLTYMLAYENQAAHDQGWANFGADPAWKKLSSTPGLRDFEIVCNISNLFLRPTGYSQI